MRAKRGLVVVGDALLDRDVRGAASRLSPEAPVPVLDEGEREARPGGAALAAALASRDGWPVTLVTALADDEAGRELRGLLALCDVELVDLGLDGATPEKVRFIEGGRSLLRVDRGDDAAAVGAPGASARAAINWGAAVLVSDYGRGVAAQPELRATLGQVAGRAPVVWDPHPRGPAPVVAVTVATPNERELERFSAGAAEPGIDAEVRKAEALREQWVVDAVCLTRGARGALLIAAGSRPLVLPSAPASGGDPCGAGDRFAARLSCGLADGRPLGDAALEAVAAASEFVAHGGARSMLRARGASPALADADALERALAVRAAGGTVVAAGGCFDLLHAGHVGMLEAARRLGDCLVVCLNSDASVRRLKGGGRPLVPASDRAAVLRALGCVDAVSIFDEDTPERALRDLRPHIWVKGGGYEGQALPEQEALAELGGRVVIVPHLGGRSTTRLIEGASGLG